MNTRQLLSVGIDIGTTTTQVIFAPRAGEPRGGFPGAAL
ncbi:ethanolamine ammonia-lyase reactivating factor EutA [Klebsiella pneumoniae subsp. pneumoniae]|nr:ethanolamine ammonia-lyase reactivating factor EutA [Klebsiella pneumoniae subsp. pneumoniae]